MVHLLLAIIYLAFISLGLPDALLGAAWPSMYPQFDVPVSYAGIISMIIALEPAERPADQKAWNRKGYGTQCLNDSVGIVWFCHQSFLWDALPVGDSIWTWCGKRGCFLK